MNVVILSLSFSLSRFPNRMDVFKFAFSSNFRQSKSPIFLNLISMTFELPKYDQIACLYHQLMFFYRIVHFSFQKKFDIDFGEFSKFQFFSVNTCFSRKIKFFPVKMDFFSCCKFSNRANSTQLIKDFKKCTCMYFILLSHTHR